jgi:hypothetical protein
MDEWYAGDAEALISEFDLPRVEQDPIMAEIRRRDLKVQPSQRADYAAGQDQAIRLYTQDGEEVGLRDERARSTVPHPCAQTGAQARTVRRGHQTRQLDMCTTARHTIGHFDEVGHRRVRAAGGDPHAVGVDLAVLNTFRDGALDRFLPPLRGRVSSRSRLHLLSHLTIPS